MPNRRPIPTHVPATLLALAVAVSLGGGAAEARAAATLQGDATPARTTHSTLIQRLAEAARSLISEPERAVVKRDRHSPALRAADQHALRVAADPGAPHVQPLHAHLLNLPPPARA